MKRVLFFLLPIIIVSCGEPSNNKPDPGTSTTSTSNQPAIISYQIINAYPHDTKSYTEGLQYIDGKLLESAGQYGESNIRFTELVTGKVLKQTDIDDKYFGEGCSQLNGKVYQMTYMENTCFVYDAATLKKQQEFNYNFGQGWGMTSNGRQLIISTGSSNIFFYDPVSFKEIKRLGVTNEYGPVGNINELELIKGYLYANVWRTDNILKIDTSSGKVVGVVNLSDLRGRTGIPNINEEEENKGPEVLNGIAYDSAANRIFITGKYWPKLFEVKLDN